MTQFVLQAELLPFVLSHFVKGKNLNLSGEKTNE